MFSKQRAVHQNATGGDVSGSLPTAMFLSATAADEASGHRVQSFGWAGCLDAPDLMPAGSTIAVYIDPAIGGMGYEGNVARIVEREGEA